MRTPEPVGHRVSRWGEGPVWFADHLWSVDIEGKSLMRLDPASGEETAWTVDQRIGFALPCQNGYWIWGGDHGLYTFDTQTGNSSFLTDPEPDKLHNRFNDAAVSPDGRLFAGTIALDKTPGNAALYRMDRRQSLSVIYPSVTNSNGIGWSPDGAFVYYIDTPTRKILRFRYQASDGTLHEPEIILDTSSLLDASPDGLCVDQNGNLWIAFCHGGCVLCLNPHTGKVEERIDLPCRETTSCCFGGPGLQNLYITTGLPATNPEPLAGRVFVVQDTGTQGLPQPTIL